MSKAGRKRKIGAPRRKDGKPRTIVEDNQVQVALQRCKHHDVPLDQAKLDLAGFPLGRLWLAKKISERMFNAGQAWAALRWRHAQLMGLMLPMSRCVDWQGPGGRSLASEPDLYEVLSVRARLRDLRALLHRTMRNELDWVCLRDQEPAEFHLLVEALRKLEMARA